MRSCLHSSGLFFSLILVAVSAQNVGERCRKPSNRPGTCISIRECPNLLALLNRPNPNLNVLHEASCGFNGRVPLVCCADPVVPKPAVPKPATTPTSETLNPSLDASNHRNIRLLPMDTCGPLADSRIFGGKETGVLEYPWMALLGYDNKGEFEFKCGGSLISDRYVLTAAHCVTSLHSSLILKSVRLGEHDIKKPVDCDIETKMCAPTPLDFDIEQAIPHQQYSKRVMKYDIAIIRLRGFVDFRQSPIRAICLPVGPLHQNRNLDQNIVIVAGWGVTEKGTQSDVQMKLNVPVVPLDKCSAIYPNSQIGPTQLCAGGKKGQDSCSGDSGGPLFFLGLVGEEQKTVQYGVVSFGPRECGTEGMPGVYTRVGYYMDWILDNMRP